MADTTDPAVGTVAITLPAYTSDTIEWTKDALYTYVAAEMLSFYIRITTGLTPKSAMQFKLRDNSTGYYYLFSSKIVNLRDYGFVQSDTDWQLIQIPLSAFSANTRVQTQYDEFEITFTATPIIELDWIVIQGSVINPSNQVTVKFIDGDSALDAVYTEGNVGIGTTTPTSKLEVVGDMKISGVNDFSGLLIDPPTSSAIGGGYIAFRNSALELVGGIDYRNTSAPDLTDAIHIKARQNTIPIVFSTTTAAQSDISTERMRITPSGNVGIGILIPTEILDVVGNIKSSALIRTGGYTVATLPAGTVGDRAYVTDATTPTYNAALTGGGAVVVPVFYNGSAWVSA